jgi:hypothetical protein
MQIWKTQDRNANLWVLEALTDMVVLDVSSIRRPEVGSGKQADLE